MYYIWESDAQEVYEFFFCGMVRDFDVNDKIPWNIGRRITQTLPEVIQYSAENMLKPEDYVFTSTSLHFLVSKRIVNILKELNIEGVDYYESEIIRPNGEKLTGFSTLNIYNVLDCVDKDKSVYKLRKYGPIQIPDFKEIYLDYRRIPDSMNLFRIKDDKTILMAHSSIKEAFEREGITGVKFIPTSNER